MSSYPIVFGITGTTKASKNEGGDGGPFPHDRLVGGDGGHFPDKKAFFTVGLMLRSDMESHRFYLAEVKGWPETKTGWKEECRKVFGRKVCTKIPVVQVRKCKLSVFVDVGYPAGELETVKGCVESAALAAAVAAIISSGSAAVPSFKAALEACLVAKAIKWASGITVASGTDSQCGDWHLV